MKKLKILALFFGLLFFGTTSAYAYMGVGLIKVSEDRTKYEIRGATLKRTSLAEKQKFVFDEQNAANYVKKIEEYLTPYYSNIFKNGAMNDAGDLVSMSALIPAELLSWRTLSAGGTSGSCKYINHQKNCQQRDIPSKWHWVQQTSAQYLREAYPTLPDQLVAVTRPDIYEPIVLQNSSFFPNKIIENGNLDSDGRWVSYSPIKVYESEYKNGYVDLKVNVLNPYGSASAFFAKDALNYNELSGGTDLYDESITSEEQLKKACASAGNDSYNCMYAIKFAGNKKYLGTVYSIPIDTDKNVIHGMWFTAFGGPTENLAIQRAFDTYHTIGFGAIYEFEIPIEVIPDKVEEDIKEEQKQTDEKTGMKDNNAKIFIDDQELYIANKKDYDLGRIYVSLADICKNVDSCKIEQGKDKEGKDYYRITRNVLNTNVKFSLVHYPKTKIFETAVYKGDKKINYDIISPATGYIDAESRLIKDELYVPIRFILEGLGANISYVSAKNETTPEEVHISFTDNGGITINSSTIKKEEKKEDCTKYNTIKKENLLNINSVLTGTKAFYSFQLNGENAPIEKNDQSDYDKKVNFSDQDNYKYLLVGKIKDNGSELLTYQIIDIEYKE